jgi:hypothetical protein
MLSPARSLVLSSLTLLLFLSSCATENTVSRGGFAILKVNRTLFDNKGYETKEVGELKEEAVYQYELRHHPELQRGARFHIKWKAPRGSAPFRLVLDVQGLTADNVSTRGTFTQDYPEHDGWAEWATMDISGKEFKRLGTIMAWRISLYKGDRVMAELPSGNWYSDIQAGPLTK